MTMMTVALTGQRAEAGDEPVGDPRRDGMATGHEPPPANAPLLDTWALCPIPDTRSNPWPADAHA